MGQIEANEITEPQDAPIPCAVRVGAITFEPGTPFSVAIDRALSELEMARALLDQAASVIDDTGNTENAPLLRQIDGFLSGQSVAEHGGKIGASRNARLFAAAPDLLDVLQKMLDVWEHGGIATYPIGEARAAIAAATGAQQ